jgi:GT2 family glycosyltransferase
VDRIGYETSQYIYAGHGSCYVLTPYYFEKNFFLDDSSFLMGEEFLLAKQIRDTGGRIYYNHNLRLIHNEHSTMDKMPSEVVYSYMQKAHKLIWRLY